MTDWTPEREAEAKKWADICEGDTVGIGAYLPDAIREIERLKEELRIAKTSWNYEEGQRCFAERDEALAEAKRLRRERDEAERAETAWVAKLNVVEEQLAQYREGAKNKTWNGHTAQEWYEEVDCLHAKIKAAKTALDNTEGCGVCNA